MRHHAFDKIRFLLVVLSFSVFIGCHTADKSGNVVNLYSTRHYDIDKVLYAEFTKNTGIEVNVVKSDPDALLVRMEQEMNNPQADVFFTADYPRLHRAVEMGLVEPLQSETLLAQTDPNLRDGEGKWYAMTSRVRIIAVASDFAGPRPQTYGDLAKPEYKGMILARSGSNAYNVSWVASLIGQWGEEKTLEFLKGFVANFARAPEGNDRKQISDIYAGKGKIALVNSYYMGGMLNSLDPEEKKAAMAVDLIYPEGTHQNISGFALIKGAKHKENALKLLEYLTNEDSQKRITSENSEYPVNPNVQATDVFSQWGGIPDVDKTKLPDWGQYYEQAVRLIDEAGWK